MSKKPSISVVLSTYNAEAWLEKVLYGFQYQDFKDFELVIAHDGSRKETKDLIDLMLLWFLTLLCMYGKKTKVFRNLEF